ncbi:hypothetical protein D3C76_764270 [compost metagenome]
MQQVQSGLLVRRAGQCPTGTVEGHQQRARRRQAFASLEAGPEVFANLGNHLMQQRLRCTLNPRRVGQQVQQVQRHTYLAQGDAGVLADYGQARQMLHQSIQYLHAQAPVIGQTRRLGEADNVAPGETGQAFGCKLSTERPGDQGPDKGEQQADGACQVGVGEAEEVRVVGALDTDER